MKFFMHVSYSVLIPLPICGENLTSVWAPKMEGKYVAYACSFSPHSPTCIHALVWHTHSIGWLISITINSPHPCSPTHIHTHIAHPHTYSPPIPSPPSPTRTPPLATTLQQPCKMLVTRSETVVYIACKSRVVATLWTGCHMLAAIGCNNPRL